MRQQLDLPDEVVTLESLGHERRHLSIESLAVPTALTQGQGFARYLGNIKRFLLDVNFLGLAYPHVDASSLVKQLERHNFMVTRELYVDIPANLAWNWVQTSDLFRKLALRLADLELGLVQPAIAAVATGINDPSSLTSFSGVAMRTRYADLGDTAFAQRLAEAFQGGNAKEARLGEMVARVQDVRLSFDDLNEANKRFAEINPKTIDTKVTRLVDLIELLKKRIDDGSITPAPAVVEQLAQTLYQIASEIELYSQVLYRLDLYTKSVQSSRDRLLKTLQKLPVT